MQNYPKIAIIYLSFHCEPYIDDVVSSLKKLTYPKERVEFIIVDNPHPQYGSSFSFLEENVVPLSGKELPHTTMLPQKENLGFAGGNNVGVEWAIANNFDYVYFHNNDGFMAANCLEPMVEAMEKDKTIGAAQSLMLLHPETDLVNSSGNAFHYLGFGFCNEYKMKYKDLQLPPVKEVSYASGAAFMVSVDVIKKYGAWDKDFFLYHEDLEWCMRLRVAGYKIAVVRDSIFYHKYQFARSITKFYYMERNRYGTMLMFFRWPTLLLLLPIALPLEIGLWIFAYRGGWAKEKARVYAYWTNSKNWKMWLQKRKYIQRIRKVSDRHLMNYAVSKIEFQDKSTDNPLVHFLANPIMTLYYKLIVKGIIWW
jgi:GT2 family glycosyltransferase